MSSPVSEVSGQVVSGTLLPVPVLGSSSQPGASPASVYLAGLAPSGRRTMRRALDTLAGLVSAGRADAMTLPWHGWRQRHTQAVRQALCEDLAPATVNKHLSALRGVLRATFDLGLISAEDLHRAMSVKRVTESRIPAGRALAAWEVQSLIRTCRTGTAADRRDAALIGVLYGCGLRRAEAVGLDLDDFDPDSGRLHVRRGKGRKARIVWATGGALHSLGSWLDLRGDAPGPLFVPIDKAGRLQAERALSGQAVLHICKVRAERADLAAFSPHDLRRTFIGDLLDRGADIATVQQLAGHADVTTTTRYDRRPDVVKRRASELLTIPFIAPGGDVA